MPQQWIKMVEWQDKTISPVDLNECQDWSPDPGRIMAPHLYRCPSGRYFFDVSGRYIEIAPLGAARLLLSWRLRLPPDLALAVQESEQPPDAPRLTLPLPVATSKDGAVILYGKTDQPIVLDQRKPMLSPARYDVVLALLRVSPDRLNKYRLNELSRHESARAILKSVKESDSDWNQVIHFPGTSHLGGYWIGQLSTSAHGIGA